jgi:hypothetical protein
MSGIMEVIASLIRSPQLVVEEAAMLMEWRVVREVVREEIVEHRQAVREPEVRATRVVTRTVRSGIQAVEEAAQGR